MSCMFLKSRYIWSWFASGNQFVLTLLCRYKVYFKRKVAQKCSSLLKSQRQKGNAFYRCYYKKPFGLHFLVACTTNKQKSPQITLALFSHLNYYSSLSPQVTPLQWAVWKYTFGGGKTSKSGCIHTVSHLHTFISSGPGEVRAQQPLLSRAIFQHKVCRKQLSFKKLFES